MKSYILILLTVLVSFSSCSVEGDDDIPSFLPALIPIESAEVPLEFKLGDSYQIRVKYYFPNGCYVFNDIYYEKDGNSRIIAINAILNNSQVCTQSIIEGEHTFTLKCTQLETYVLKFWQGKDIQGVDQYLIIEVPVIN